MNISHHAMRCAYAAVLFAGGALAGGQANADQVFADDVIVQGSLCVGFDCVNAENFGFDTIRLKENNLRIHFNDTSSSGAFPTTDWRIVANDTTNGGSSYLAFEDADTGRKPFLVVAGAPAAALFVKDNGNVGMGTSSPILRLHLVRGDSPAIRLEQDGSSGFTPQTWDIAGNEANFFVRDATNGSALPFKIRPGAPTDSLVIEPTTGDVGFGAGTNPTAPIHVKRSNGTAQILVEETSSTTAARGLASLKNNGIVFLRMEDTSQTNGAIWNFQNNTGNAVISSPSGTNTEFTLTTAGNLIIGGTLTENSDVNTKTNIVKVNENDVLERVNKLDIAEWSYKTDKDVKHIGPMAQDFYALFGTGISETKIATIDTSGVALASIKAISARIDEKEARLKELEEAYGRIDKLTKENTVMQDRLADVSARLQRIEHR